ncbi:MAG TPA: hypothetical protein VNT42_10040 [Sphingomonas sp.]|nr:hypothetical protein [Sphingomonas sp.]
MIALLLAAAATSQPACVRMQPVPGFEGWGHPSRTALAVDKEVGLKLDPATKVNFKPALSRRPQAGTYGGYFPITVAKAGTYRFAASDGAWLDLVTKGDRLKSSAHMHGPACSGIAKIVAFDLKPGRYWLQLSEAKTRSIGVMVSAR